MRYSKQPFLMSGDPAYEAMKKWEVKGIYCQLDKTGKGIDIVNYTWLEPGEPPPKVPDEAFEELGEHYDEILAYLQWWEETREQWEEILKYHQI